jgi:hypothetical protein
MSGSARIFLRRTPGPSDGSCSSLVVHPAGEEQSRADGCAGDRRSPERRREAGRRDGTAIHAPAPAAPRSFLAGSRAHRRPALGCVAALIGLLLTAAPARAATPWWSIDTSVRPAVIPSGGEGTVVVRAANLGDAPTQTSETVEVEPGRTIAIGVPSSVSLTLPEGLEVVSEAGVPQIRFEAFSAEGDHGPDSPVGSLGEYCTLSGRRVECDTEPVAPFNQREAAESFGIAPLAPYEFLEILVRVKDRGAAASAPLVAAASGGGAGDISRSRPLRIGSGAPVFGAESYTLSPEAQGGDLETRAGAHPYQLTADLSLNQLAEEATAAGPRHVAAPALPRRLAFNLPPGLVGNATALPTCSEAEFNTILLGGANACPAASTIGVATITLDEPNDLDLATFPVPLFNLEPAAGEPARFGAELFEAPIVLDTSVRSGPGGDYGITASASDITQVANLISASVTFWGVPGDPSHDDSRGWSCLVSEHWVVGGLPPCAPGGQSDPSAFLTLPGDCSAPWSSSVEGESWTDPALHPLAATFGPFPDLLEDGAGHPLALTACDQVPFAPRIEARTSTHSASSPTGLDLDVGSEDEGLLSSQPGARAQSPLNRALITLPPGLTANPSLAVGLGSCSQAEYEAATVGLGMGCNGESKIGEVAISSPLLAADQVLRGGLFLATPRQNPNHNLLTVYLIARDAEVGVLVRQALKLTPDPLTGRLTAEVDEVPQLPFSDIHLSFRSGPRSPLVTPSTCGTYAVGADLYPWSDPATATRRDSAFAIDQGPEGGGCPVGAPPFGPTVLAGSENPVAGAYSTFSLDLARKDPEAEITSFSSRLPAGVLADLKGVAECPDADIGAAGSRETEGGAAAEEAAPSCPADSLIGHTEIGAGVGSVLAHVPGRLYLAGPYQGSRLSVVAITAATVGPFDLGTVVVRLGLRVDPETAEVSLEGSGADPLPQVIDGIPVRLREIRVDVDRPSFALNPTSCAKKATAATILGTGDASAAASSPYQVAGCASLAFRPSLALSLLGRETHRGALPGLKAVLTYPQKGAGANLAGARVTLPASEILEQAHLRDVCTRKVFETGAHPGENCPRKSIYGHARALTPLLEKPLEGPVYLRTGYGTKLPELAAALNGPQVDLDLAGRIDAVHTRGSRSSRLRATFALVPDAPVTRFTLELKGGRKGLLVNSTDVCRGTHRALVAFTGQNGKLHEVEPALQARCGARSAKRPTGTRKSSQGR